METQPDKKMKCDFLWLDRDMNMIQVVNTLFETCISEYIWLIIRV